MVLQCECGGALELRRGTDPVASDRGWFEVYKCVSCGRTGGYSFDPISGEETSGCVEIVEDSV